jgi:hypothetical protein
MPRVTERLPKATERYWIKQSKLGRRATERLNREEDAADVTGIHSAWQAVFPFLCKCLWLLLLGGAAIGRNSGDARA